MSGGALGRCILQAEPNSATISVMVPVKLRAQEGSINILLLPLILAILFFLGTAGFAYWAYSSRQDYKNNTDQKISKAVALAKQQEDTKKDADFVQQEKKPLETYSGPEAYGSLKVNYPKNWSAYVAETETGSSMPIDGYFYPGTVPSTTNPNSTFALRVQVTQQSYSDTLSSFNGLVQSGQVTVKPYSLPGVPSVVGVRIEGQIVTNKSGSMVILPLRNTTLKVWTEASQFENDFNNNILPNLTFSP